MTLGYGFGYRSEQDSQENQGESVLGIHLRYCAHYDISSTSLASTKYTTQDQQLQQQRQGQ